MLPGIKKVKKLHGCTCSEWFLSILPLLLLVIVAVPSQVTQKSFYTTVYAGVPKSLLLLTRFPEILEFRGSQKGSGQGRLLQGPHFVVRPHGQMGKQINLFLSLIVKLIPVYWALPW